VLVHRIRIYQLMPDLTRRELLSFRAAGSQLEAEAFGERLRTRIMRQNPGIATQMITDWPRSEELGGKHVMPPNPECLM